MSLDICYDHVVCLSSYGMNGRKSCSGKSRTLYYPTLNSVKISDGVRPKSHAKNKTLYENHKDAQFGPPQDDCSSRLAKDDFSLAYDVAFSHGNNRHDDFA